MQLCMCKGSMWRPSRPAKSCRPVPRPNTAACRNGTKQRSHQSPVIAQGLFGWGREPVTAEVTTETGEPTSATTKEKKDAPTVLPPTIDMQPMTGAYGADPPQSLIDEQLAHMIDPELDEFVEEVAQQLPLIRAELGDQQALLSACNQFLEDMAERHLNLLLQQQNTARTAASRPNTPSAAGVEALALQAYGQLEQQLQEVSAQLELERQQAGELLQQKDALNKQLRIVSMEREELKQQTQGREEASAASAQLQDTLDQLSEAQEKLTAAEAKLDEARDTNKQLTEQLQHANTAVEVAKASALAATSSVTAETHAQLQEASARAASLEAQLLASKKNSAAVADSNKILQQQLRQSHVQGKRLITMNRHLMKHAEQLEGRCQQQATLVSVLKEDKAAMAAELGRIYDMLQDMAGAQQRQQKLQQQLLEIIAQQQQQQQCQEPGKDTGDAVVGAAGSDAGSTQGAVAADSDSSSGLVRVLSSAMLAVAMPIMGQFVR